MAEIDRVHAGSRRATRADARADVTDGGNGSAAGTARAAHARRRTAARGHKRRAPGRRGQHGEHAGDQNGGGGGTDDDGDEEEAAATFGSTTARLLRRASAAAKGRTRTATQRRSRRRSSRMTATAGTAAELGWSGGGDREAWAHGARVFPTTR